RGDDVLLSLCLTLSLPQLGEHRCRTQRSTPGAEILGGVRELRHFLDIVVDVAGVDVVPLSILQIAEQTGTRRLQQRRYEAGESFIDDDVALRDRSLSLVLEFHHVA